MVDLTIRRLTAGWPKSWSYDKDDPDIQIYYSQQNPNSAINKTSSFFYGKKLWDVFTYAMCIGKMNNDFDPIKGTPSNSIPIDHVDDWHVTAMISIMMSEKNVDLNIFDTPEKIRDICQGYANGGIKKLMEIDDDKFKDDANERFGDELMKFFKSK